MTLIKSYLSVVFISILTYSCGNSQRKTESVAVTSGIAQQSLPNGNLLFPTESDTILLEVHNGKATLYLHKEASQSVHLQFDSDNYTKMKGLITSPDSMANIRFSQIIMPDGRMDGPFGREIAYSLPVKGVYNLILNESLMAGDPWEGNFEVNITLNR